VERWNNVVTDDDIVYHLGDFTLKDLRHFTKWANWLNGNIRILPGNMDRLWLQEFVSNKKVLTRRLPRRVGLRVIHARFFGSILSFDGFSLASLKR